MMNKFEALEKSMCRELEAIEQKLKGGAEMSVQDLEKADKLAHAMKSLATYKAMKEAEGYEEDAGFSGDGSNGGNMGNSGYRGRAMNGRYVSRTGRMYPQSYDEGYAQGYSEAMNQQSGHIPMPYYYGERRW